MRLTTCGLPCLALLIAAGCCDQIQEDAHALKAKQAKCGEGDTCVLVSMYDVVGDDSCLGAFQCSTALNAAGLDGFKDEAKELTERFTHCNECVQAGCADTSGYEAFCDEEAGQCDMRPVDEGVDGGV